MQTNRDLHTAHKVVVLGDSRVGKTSIIFQRVHGCQSTEHKATIGCTCQEVSFYIDNRTVSLQIWDTAGQEIYRSLVPVYVRGAQAALIVYDITESNSFQGLDTWFTLLDDTIGLRIPIFVVGNKTDLSNQKVVEDELAAAFAKSRNAKFHMVSAVSGDGIGKLFDDVARSVMTAAVTEAVPLPQATTEQSRCC